MVWSLVTRVISPPLLVIIYYYYLRSPRLLLRNRRDHFSNQSGVEPRGVRFASIVVILMITRQVRVDGAELIFLHPGPTT